MLREGIAAVDNAVDYAMAEGLSMASVEEVGTVVSADRGYAIVRGLRLLQNQELVSFDEGLKGIAFNLDRKSAGIMLLGDFRGIAAGQQVRRTFSVVDIPVSMDFIGRVVSPLGEPLDDKGEIKWDKRLPIEREAPPIMSRSPVSSPIQTGIKVIDAVVPIGKGQRELILGDRQTGKTAIAVDTVINQKGKDVICIYCAIGQQISSVTKMVSTLKLYGAMEHTVVMVAGTEDPPGVAYIAPYAATSLAEYFMSLGKDVLIIYDDLTKHARAYRELSLLLERTPGREAYPGDIFYIHSRLLERATHLREEYGGGSITALPIVETQAENISAYIPTNLISITDGQVYLSPKLFQKGNLPAVMIGVSVSRVGGKTQLPAYRAITSSLKLSYSQYEELEVFSRFGTGIDESTRKVLERGKRIRKVLNQKQFSPMEVTEQIGVLLAVTRGLFDTVPLEDISRAEEIVMNTVREHKEFREPILMGEKVSEDIELYFLEKARDALGKEF
ncbi:F0F1 ATP synthase subunit alpha [Youngiibacter fragilis]|uniref:ATP synthase subunit alpha n=1 Tax=Youngiibacter fragilis 232.1 TaxID=994573 RepID=V7I4N4_9CLOT|nr:F0F1 ATP synthase subunit alpha [Youngiibacter fragilis]ETA81195.1 F0F1 ATP synthase subunit alpha [Youngiibacter fragilis 232.1]